MVRKEGGQRKGRAETMAVEETPEGRDGDTSRKPERKELPLSIVR